MYVLLCKMFSNVVMFFMFIHISVKSNVLYVDVDLLLTHLGLGTGQTLTLDCFKTLCHAAA